MRVLVTGGAGFLGSHLVDRLLIEGIDVEVVDDLSTGSWTNLAEARRSPFGSVRIHQLAAGDAGVEVVARRHGIDAVVHLVTAARADAAEDAALVLGSGVRAVQAALAGGADRLVTVFEAATLYRVPRSVRPVREPAASPARSAYAATRLAFADHLRLARDAAGLEWVALLLPHVYGARQMPGRGWLTDLVRRAVGVGEPAEVRAFPGATAHDLLFVADAVEGIVAALGRGSGLLVNLGTGTPVFHADLVARVGGLGSSGPLTGAIADPAVGRRVAPSLLLDPSRAKLHLGWAATTGIDQGLDRVAQWLRSSP